MADYNFSFSLPILPHPLIGFHPLFLPPLSPAISPETGWEKKPERDRERKAGNRCFGVVLWGRGRKPEMLKEPRWWEASKILIITYFSLSFRKNQFLHLGKTLSAKTMSSIRTLFPVACRVCFILLFLAKPYRFDAVFSFVYMVLILVYPNCTQEEIFPKVVTCYDFF